MELAKSKIVLLFVTLVHFFIGILANVQAFSFGMRRFDAGLIEISGLESITRTAGQVLWFPIYHLIFATGTEAYFDGIVFYFPLLLNSFFISCLLVFGTAKFITMYQKKIIAQPVDGADATR